MPHTTEDAAMATRMDEALLVEALELAEAAYQRADALARDRFTSYLIRGATPAAWTRFEAAAMARREADATARAAWVARWGMSRRRARRPASAGRAPKILTSQHDSVS